jgi:CPA2 family monovalent cation:H+ antiporter-2
MEQSPFLIEILITLAVAAVGVAIFERVRLPAIAGFVLTGALLGPGMLGVVQDSESVRRVAEFGVVLLLFEIGLELPIEALRRTWRSVLLAGGLQVGLTIAAVALLGPLVGLDSPAGLAMGAIIAMSSTSLVMRTLAERGETDAPHGHLAIGVLVFQDLCLVPLLLAVPLLTGEASLSLASLGRALMPAIGGLALLYLVVRFVLPWLLERVLESRSRDLSSLTAFVLALGSAAAAGEFGLTYGIGAFAAGLVLGTSPYAPQLRAEIVPMRGTLLGLFFTSMGMLFDGRAALELWQGALLFALAAVVLKGAIVLAVTGIALRRGIRLGVMTALALAQTGEFSFLLADRAVATGLFDRDLQQIFIAGSVPTLVATPFLIGIAPRLANWLSGRVPRRSRAERVPTEGHVVVVGLGLTGRTIARVLRAAGTPCISVDLNPAAARQARSAGESALWGDATSPDLMRQLSVGSARLVVIAISDPTATRNCVAAVRAAAPEVPVVARTRYAAEMDALRGLGASHVVAEELEATLDILDVALRVLDLPGALRLSLVTELRQEGYAALRDRRSPALDALLAEILSEAGTTWIDVTAPGVAGRSLRELEVRTRTGASILALERDGRVQANPAPGQTLRGGDRALALGDATEIARLRDLLEASAATPMPGLEPAPPDAAAQNG